MASFKVLVLASVLVVLSLSETDARRLCGVEVEYAGFDPLEALKVIQLKQIEEFNNYRSQLKLLKFNQKSDDFLAWNRCLSEYEKERLAFINMSNRVKTKFLSMVQRIKQQNLEQEAYEQELRKLLTQFQTEYSPTVELFRNNIRNLFDTIRDEKRRRQWWSTVKTTEVTTNSDGSQTRTSMTKTAQGIGGQQTGAAFSKSSKTMSNNGIQEIQESGQSNMESGYQGSISKIKSKTSGYGSGDDNDDGGYGNGKQRNGYSTDEENDGQQSGSDENSGYSSGASTQTRSKSFKKESFTSGKESSGSTAVDNEDINFSQAQTRTGMKDTYGSSNKDSYGSSNKDSYGSKDTYGGSSDNY